MDLSLWLVPVHVRITLNTIWWIEMLMLAISAISVSASCPPFLSGEKSCNCTSYVDGLMIRCVGSESTRVIEKLALYDVMIRELSIQQANIVEVGARSFKNLKIRNLNLDHNRIRMVHKDAFRGLENRLESLSMAHNKLTELPTDALIGMQQLRVLNLKCNNIGNIHTKMFLNVTKLIELNLACNQICKIGPAAFDDIKDSLQSLVLDNNCLKEIPAEGLRNFKNLLALHLKDNHITSIDKLQLMNLMSLLLVRLSNNRITKVDQYGFNNVPNLRYLFLDHNELSVVEPKALRQFKYLEIVDLSYNNIVEVPDGAFQHLENLMQLNLEGNLIQDIAPNAFAKTPLLVLLLAHNCLNTVSHHMFQGIPFLKQLSLASNNIKIIQPFAFVVLPNIHLIDLSHNQLDNLIPVAVAPTNKVTVLLRENPLVCGENGYHVIQNGSPTLLLDEPNLICKENDKKWKEQCPNRVKVTQAPTCCNVDNYHEDVMATSQPVVAAKTTLTTDNMKANMTTVKTTHQGEMIPSVMTTVPPSTSTATVGTTITAALSEAITVTQQPVATINMERFWRFTPPPKQRKMVVNDGNMKTAPAVVLPAVTPEATAPMPFSMEAVVTSRFASHAVTPAMHMLQTNIVQPWSGAQPPVTAKPVTTQTGLSREQLIQLYNQRMAQKQQQLLQQQQQRQLSLPQQQQFPQQLVQQKQTQQQKPDIQPMVPPQPDVWIPAEPNAINGNGIIGSQLQPQQRPNLLHSAVMYPIQQPHFLSGLSPQFKKTDPMFPASTNMNMKSLPVLEFSHDRAPSTVVDAQPKSSVPAAVSMNVSMSMKPGFVKNAAPATPILNLKPPPAAQRVPAQQQQLPSQTQQLPYIFQQATVADRSVTANPVVTKQ